MSGHLTTHQQSVRMGKKYLCEECDNQFTQKGHLTTHQSAWARNILVRNVVTKLHGRAVSPPISSQSIWVRNIYVRNVITK